MASSGFEILMLLFLLMSGGPSNNDLLDMISSDAYWNAKGVVVTVDQLQQDAAAKNQADPRIAEIVRDLSSPEFSVRESAKSRLAGAGTAALPALRAAAASKDPEVAAIAEELITKLSKQAKSPEIRRLMAIRTLGERHESRAAALLRDLSKDADPFIAEYAQRSLAQIENRPWRRPNRMPDLAPDLALLPRDTGIVGQTTGVGIPGFSIDSFAKEYLARAGRGDPGAAKKPLAQALTREVIRYAEQVGNVRADGMTVAVSRDIGGNRNWIVASFHGQYDSHAAINFLHDAFQRGGGDPTAIYQIGDATAIQIDREATIILVSDRQALFIVTEDRKVPGSSIIVPVMVALGGGKSALPEKGELDQLIRSVGHTGPVWAAGIPSGTMKRELPLLAPFESMTLSSRQKDSAIDLTLTAVGPASQAKESAEQLNTIIQGVIKTIDRDAQQMPAMQTVREAFQSIKITPGPTGASATATVPATIGQTVLDMLSEEVNHALRRWDEEAAPPETLPAGVP